MLIPLDLSLLHEGAHPNISLAEFVMLIMIVDEFVSPMDFVSQEFDRLPERLILFFVVLHLETTGASARNFCLCIFLDLHKVLEV